MLPPSGSPPPSWPYGPPGYGPPPYGWPFPPAWAPPPTPRPRGVPSRSPFLVGAIGHFIAAALSIVYGVGMFFGLGFHLYSESAGIPGAALSAAFSVSLLLALFGFYGLWRNYGSAMGAAAFAYGLIAVIIFLVSSVLTLFAVQTICEFWGCYTIYASWGIVLLIASFVLLGVAFILDGVAFIVARRFTGLQGGAVAAGVLFIVGGSFVVSILLALFGGFFVLAPAFILGGLVLLRAPVPGARWPTPVVAPSPPFGPA